MKKWTALALIFFGTTLGNAQQTPVARDAALQSGYDVSVGGTTRRLDVVTTEVAVKSADGQRNITSITGGDVRHAARAQRAKSVGAGGAQDVEIILTDAPSTNPKQRPGLAARQHFVTREILVRLKAGTTAQQLAAKTGLNVASQPAYAPGFVILDAGASEDALPAMEALRALPEVESADVLLATQKAKKYTPNDPFFSDQWHLRNTTQLGGALWIDANLTTAWDVAKGSGVVIGIVDDGVQYTHPDLTANYNTTLDFDYNGNDSDPAPVSVADRHGTAVAGVAGARGNNSIGVTGAAPLATLTGIRLISAATTDTQDANAFLLNNNSIHIKNCSWGGTDGSFTYVDGPGPLAAAALETGATNGRGGKGVVYVFASGNGMLFDDNSNLDGFANNPFVLAVTSVNDFGFQSSYAEPGANILVAAPSSGNIKNQGVRTTDITGTGGYNIDGSAGEMANTDYTNTFGGTSSAAPLVSGVVALMLEANPNLGWRDVKEILIRTARRNQRGDTDWATNSAGLSFNHKYGAGIVDAAAAVALAQQWTNLPAMTTTTVSSAALSINIPDNTAAGISYTSAVSTADFRVETVAVTVTAIHTWVGDLEITLTSPSGMTSKLVRQIWNSTDDLNWTFSTVRHWGESAAGNWTLNVADRAAVDTGRLTGVSLKLFGSTKTGAKVVGSGANLVAEGNTPANTVADPGEAVTFNFGLKNTGTAATTNLTATLLPMGGVTSPSAPQNYGALPTNGDVTLRSFSFRPQGGCGTSANVILQLQDGATNLGYANLTVPLGTAAVTTFTNSSLISILDASTNPYPSVLNVAGLTGRVQRLTFEFGGFTHQRPSDLGFLLVSPQALKLRVINGGPSTQASGVSVVMDDNGNPLYPWSATFLNQGPYRPYEFSTTRAFPSEPNVTLTKTFGEFIGPPANGAWNLYIKDFVSGSIGSCGNWKLNFTTANCTDNVMMDQSAISNSEAVGNVSVSVTRTGGQEGSATVNYATSNGTATAGSDYTATSGTLTFAAGELTKTFLIPINNDSTMESDETINVTLSTAGGNTTLGTLATTTVTIQDNDTVTPVSLSPATPTVNEAATTLTFTVSRTVAGGAGTVAWSTTAGTASAGSDFTAGSGTVTFGAADLSQTFNVSLLNDGVAENPESFTVTIQTPTGVLSLGSPTTSTVTIVDADTDSDGMVDDYETSFGLNAAVNDAALDLDGDGVSNFNEFILGSPPNSSASQFKPTATKVGNDVTIVFPSLTGRTYTVEFKLSLASGWSTLQGGIAGTGSNITVTDTGGGLQPQKFYRITVTKP